MRFSCTFQETPSTTSDERISAAATGFSVTTESARQTRSPACSFASRFWRNASTSRTLKYDSQIGIRSLLVAITATMPRHALTDISRMIPIGTR